MRLFLNKALLLNLSLLATTPFKAVADLEGAVNNIEVTIEDIQVTATTVSQTVGAIEDKIDAFGKPFIGARLLRSGEDVVFRGDGCDGVDNNNNDMVDECAEDTSPPVVTVDGTIPDSFESVTEANEWFHANLLGTDDCAVDVDLQFVSNFTQVEDTNQYVITVKAVDCRCESIGEGAFESSERTFTITIDGDAPVVTCGFDKEQDPLYINSPIENPNGTAALIPTGTFDDPLFISYETEQADLVDVGLSYNVTDASDIDNVRIKVFSSEIELNQRDRRMAEIFETAVLNGPNSEDFDVFEVFLAPFTCDQQGLGPGSCKKYSANPGVNTRTYQIKIIATDSVGNVGETECYVQAWVPFLLTATTSKSIKGSKSPKSKSAKSEDEDDDGSPVTNSGSKGKGGGSSYSSYSSRSSHTERVNFSGRQEGQDAACSSEPDDNVGKAADSGTEKDPKAS